MKALKERLQERKRQKRLRQQQQKRRVLIAAAGCFLLVAAGLTALNVVNARNGSSPISEPAGAPASSPTRAHAPAATDEVDTSTESTEQSWTPPSDGVWPESERKGLGYGEPFQISAIYVDTYVGVIQGPPAFSGYDNGHVTMSQQATFTRIDASNIGAVKIADVEPMLQSGRDDLGELNPAGREGEMECQSDIPNVGDSTICTLSASVSTSDVKNSSWVIGNSQIGAWPGQQTIGY